MATIGSSNQKTQKKRKFSRHFDRMPRPKLKQGYDDGGFVQDTTAPTGVAPNPVDVPGTNDAPPVIAPNPDNAPGTNGAPTGVTPQDYQAALSRAAADKKELAGIEAAKNTESLRNRAAMPVDLSGGFGQAMASFKGRNAARLELTGGPGVFNISRPALARPALARSSLARLADLYRPLLGRPAPSKPTDLVSQAASLGYQGGINPGYTNVDAASLLENSPRPSLYYSRGTARVLGPRGVDKVDAKLTAGEAVLPVETVEALGRENIEELIRATTGKEPKNSLRRGGRYATGVVDDEQLMRLDAARQAAYATNAGGAATGVNVAPRISRRANTIADREDAAQGAAMQAAILETRPPATRAATTAFMQPAGTPAQRPTQEAPTPPLADTETYAGQTARGIAADASLARVDRAVGKSSGDTASINTRINNFRGNPQAVGDFNNAQSLNRTGIMLERDSSGNLTLRGDPNAKPKIYKGVDGQDTTNWSDTQEYQSAIARNAADKAELAKIEDANQREALMRRVTRPTLGSMQEMVQGRLDRAGARSELARLNQQEQVAQQQAFQRPLQTVQIGKLKQDIAKGAQEASERVRVMNLRQQLMNAKTPEERRRIQSQLYAIQGRQQPRYQIVTEDTFENGMPVKKSYIIEQDEQGNPQARPVVGAQQPGKTSAAMPRVGETRAGYRFLGGNPNDRSNWVPAR